jgi:hypothetical protein
MSFSDPPMRRRSGRLIAAMTAVAMGAGLLVLAPAGPAGAAPRAAIGGHLDWGVKASFRAYVTGPIAHGSISTSGGATTNGDGTFRFPLASGTRDASAGSASSAHSGSVRFVGHSGALDLTISELRVSIIGSAGVLVADVSTKGFSDPSPVLYDDVELATLDLTSVTPVTTADSATYPAVPVTLTAAGSTAFAGFYSSGTAMDPLTLRLDHAPWVPTITVSKTSGIRPEGEVVTVTGTGFDPSANPSTRPPVPTGMPAGVYVVFGRFASTWKPSQGAPSSARRVISQRWAMPQGSIDAAVAAFGPNPQYVPLNPDGSFSTTLLITPNETLTGTYGIATWAAGGAAPNPSQETFTPIAFREPTGIDASASTDVALRGHRDSSKIQVTVTNTGTEPFTIGAADIAVTITQSSTPVPHPVTPTSTTRRTLSPGQSRTFTFDWAHGAAIGLGSPFTIEACTTLDDDVRSNDCAVVPVPASPVDLAVTTRTGKAKASTATMPLRVRVSNGGVGPVVVRPSDVTVEVRRNGTPVTTGVDRGADPDRRFTLAAAKTRSFAMNVSLTRFAIGDLVELVVCVPVPGDDGPADNCASASTTVVR